MLLLYCTNWEAGRNVERCSDKDKMTVNLEPQEKPRDQEKREAQVTSNEIYMKVGCELENKGAETIKDYLFRKLDVGA